VEAGRLLREGRLGPERVGDVLPGQTRFWVGPEFGFGFYRAGDLHVSFVFESSGRGLNDGVRLPPLRGQLLDADCSLSAERAWFFTATQDGARAVHRCAVVGRDGSVLAMAEAEPGDGSWLAGIHGHVAAGGFLLAAGDGGIARVEPQGGRLVVTRVFPDTEPFVDAGCRLLAGADGLLVVDRQEVRRLRIGA
jgi:H/ACA ribonucleoprotein complex subunit 3